MGTPLIRNSYAVCIGTATPFISEWLRRSFGICTLSDIFAEICWILPHPSAICIHADEISAENICVARRRYSPDHRKRASHRHLPMGRPSVPMSVHPVMTRCEGHAGYCDSPSADAVCQPLTTHTTPEVRSMRFTALPAAQPAAAPNRSATSPMTRSTYSSMG